MNKLFGIVLMAVIGLALAPVQPGTCGCIDPPKGLVAWWPLDSDTKAEDIVGGKDGTLFGAPSLDDGKVAQALSLDGQLDYMTTPGVINGWPAGTIDLWVRFNSLGDAPVPPLAPPPVPIFSAVGYDSKNSAYYPIRLWASNGMLDKGFTFGFHVCDENSCDWKLAHADLTPVIDQWYHLAGTWGSEGIKLYVDGTLIDTDPYAGPFPDTIGNWIGASVLDQVFMNGMIDEVEIFDRALTDEQIVAIYNAGSEGKCKVPNTPPVARCKNVTVSAGPFCTARASVDDGSYDPDGNPITLSQTPAGPYPLGVTSVTLTVTDIHRASDTCTAEVTVVDDTPPTISSVTASPATLWPPNHKMVPVRLTVIASDNCDKPKCGIVSITSNEPVNGLGDGDTAPDWQFLPGRLFADLRAERSGKGDGRYYTISVQCSDGAGNESRVSTVKVRVPHDQRPPRDPRELTRKKFKAPR